MGVASPRSRAAAKETAGGFGPRLVVVGEGRGSFALARWIQAAEQNSPIHPPCWQAVLCVAGTNYVAALDAEPGEGGGGKTDSRFRLSCAQIC